MKRLLLTLAAATLSLVGCINGGEDEIREPLAVGAPMPEFSVTGPSGTISDADFAGKRTVVVLFRSDCPDCQRELPKVEAVFAADDTPADIEFVAISRESEAVVAAYWEEAEYSMPYYIDKGGRAFEAFSVTHVPTLYIFDSDGLLTYVAIEDAEGLQSQIDRLL
jgi:peroxiredoxin